MTDGDNRSCENCVFNCHYDFHLDSPPDLIQVSGVCLNRHSMFYNMDTLDISICGKWRKFEK